MVDALECTTLLSQNLRQWPLSHFKSYERGCRDTLLLFIGEWLLQIIRKQEADGLID